jgi:hypothetical protein
VKAGARRAIRDATWVLGPPGDRRRLRLDRSCCPQMPLGDGWPSLVRAVDAPAVQDVPAWDGTCGLASSGSFRDTRKSLEALTCIAFLTLIASREEGCGLNCLWAKSVCSQRIGDTPRSGSTCFTVGSGRSTVVFTEGIDPSPTDWGSVPEACEIGGLGTLDAVLWDGSLVREGCPAAPASGERLDRSVTKLWPGKGREPVYPLPRAAFQPRA